MLDVAIVVSVIGSGVAVLLLLFKLAARHDTRDAERSEDESRRAD